MSHHTLPEEVGEILSRVKPRMAAYAHYAIFGIDAAEVVRRTRKTYDGPLEAGVDLMSFEISGDEVKVTRFEGGAASPDISPRTSEKPLNLA